MINSDNLRIYETGALIAIASTTGLLSIISANNADSNIGASLGVLTTGLALGLLAGTGQFYESLLLLVPYRERVTDNSYQNNKNLGA